MDYTITIPDYLVPGIEATAFVEGKTVEQVIGEYALAVANKACQDLKVGPYYVGPVDPQFRADGKPFDYVDPAPEPEEGEVNPDPVVDGGDV